MLLEGAETGPDVFWMAVPKKSGGKKKKKGKPCETAYFQDHVTSEEAMAANQRVQVHTPKKKNTAFFFFFLFFSIHWLSDPRLAATQSSSASDTGDIIMVQLCRNLIGNGPDKAGSWAIIYEVKIGMWSLVTRPLN